MRVVRLIPALALLLSCAPAFREVATRPTRITNYEIGAPRHAGIGDPIFDVQAARAVPSFQVTIDYDVPDDDVPDLRAGMRFLAALANVKTGELLLGNSEFSDTYLLISDEEGNLRPGLYNIADVPFGGVVKKDIGWPRGLLTPADVVADQEGGFRAQMLYGGLDGSTVRATYREFSGNFIRPAFSQELQYDLAQDSVIAYRSIQIRVLRASNQRIEYEVIEDGGLPWLPVS